jgi:integrase
MLIEDSILGVHSRKIRQSDAFVGIPVFQSASGQPLRSAKFGGNIIGLGRLAGFKYNTTPYSLHRGYANVLYENVSTKDRRFLMGHKTNSDNYSYYYSIISTVNIQEIFYGIRTGNTTEIHGLSLNRTQ